MAEVWTMGELLVEIMRPQAGLGLKTADIFRGPYPSGAPAICIDTVARLNHSSGIIGATGADDFGQCLVERLALDGVDCSQIRQCEGESTGVAFVSYAEDGSRKFIFHIGNTPAVKVKAPSKEVLAGIQYFHIMGCSIMASETFAQEIIKTMHTAIELGAKVSFDPNIRVELMGSEGSRAAIQEVFENTNILMPGVDELLYLTGASNVDEAVTCCFANPKIEMIALKRGSQGSTVYTREQSFTRAVYPVEVVDPTGAGDSFDGAFLCGLLEGKTIPETMALATAAAALNTSAFGPMEGAISKANVAALINKNS